jgi:hypothetical protein
MRRNCNQRHLGPELFGQSPSVVAARVVVAVEEEERWLFVSALNPCEGLRLPTRVVVYLCHKMPNGRYLGQKCFW